MRLILGLCLREHLKTETHTITKSRQLYLATDKDPQVEDDKQSPPPLHPYPHPSVSVAETTESGMSTEGKTEGDVNVRICRTNIHN